MNIIDFRVTGWGHNHYIKAQPDGSYHGSCWSTPMAQTGDHILWETDYGYAVAEVEEVKFYGDPGDMYWVRCRVVERVANPDIVSQEELDEHFKAND